MKSPSFRDIELLTAYLDGQLKADEIRSLESRLQAESGLQRALEGLRETRAVLRRLPQRRAPRNFTLTARTAGIKPPLPQTYPFLRLASALAAILFVLAAATNYVVPLAAAQRALAPVAFGMGGGGAPDSAARPEGGGGCGDTPECGPAVMQAPAATEAPAATALAAATAAPAESLTMEQNLSTATPGGDLFAAPAAPGAEPATKLAPPAVTDQVEGLPVEPLIPAAWEISLLGLALAFAGAAIVVRWRTDRSFEHKQK